jgi:hypothetical protein
VYWNIRDTSPTEQSVLAALAFCHNGKTGRCDPSTSTISEMTHFGVASVIRALVSLKEKNYISWISGRNSKKGGAVSNKYTLYLSGTPSQSDIPLSQSDIPPLSEREGQSITVIYPLSHSDRQKRIEKETNTNLTKEMAGLVGKSFLEAAKPQAPKEPSGCSDAVADDVFDDFWAAYPDCIYKTPSAKARCGALYAQLRGDASDGAEFDGKVLAALSSWRASGQWTKDGGRYIPAPINFFARRLWEVDPGPSEPDEKPAAAKMPASSGVSGGKGLDWRLCEERCARFSGGRCSAGLSVPPDSGPWPLPPEECERYLKG